MRTVEGSIEEPLTVLAELSDRADSSYRIEQHDAPRSWRRLRTITEIVCVQNFYNVATQER